MGLVTGSISLTRFKAPAHLDETTFESHPFKDIDLSSEVKESIGFIPFELEAPYQIGSGRVAFRMRIDRRRADSVQVRERHKQLLLTEMESTGAPFVPSGKSAELRHLAEEELIVGRTPTSTVIECCIDDKILYAGTTSKVHLGVLQQLLRKAGVGSDNLLPWNEKGLPEEWSDLPETMDPAASIYGCRFLAALAGDQEFLFEPEQGYIRLADGDTRITLTGDVLSDLHHYLKNNAYVLAAKLLHKDLRFTLDGTTFRLSAIKFPRLSNQAWTENLDQRLEQIRELVGRLDEKFSALT